MGIDPLLTDDAELLQKADRVLFPGQGEARGAMEYPRLPVACHPDSSPDSP